MECTRVNAWLSKMPLWKFALSLSVVFVLAWSPFLLGEIGKTDEGFALSAYQQLFENPQSAEGQMLLYNGILIGAIWNYLWNGCSVVGFRFLGLLLMGLNVFIVCYILDGKVRRRSIIIGIFILLLTGEQLLSRYHDIVSGLMATFSILFIINAFEKRRIFYIFIAGIILGINVLTRIPNVSLVLLSLSLIPFFYYTKDEKITIFMLLSAIGGFLVGLLVEYVIILAFHHEKMILEGVGHLFSFIESGAEYTHSPNLLIMRYIQQIVTVMVVSVPLVAVPAFSVLVTRKMPSIVFRIVTCSILAIWYFLFIQYFRNNYDTTPAVIYALCISIMIAYVLFHPDDYSLIYRISVASIIMCCLPIGSDNGYLEMGGYECVVLAIPLSMGLLDKMMDNHCHNKMCTFLIILFLFILVVASFGREQRTIIWQFRSGQFLSKDYSLSQMRYTFTGRNMLKHTEEMMSELQKYVKNKDYLLCWQHCAYVHYLTHTYPYLNNSWVWTYDTDNLQFHIEKAQQSISYKPVLLCDKAVFYGWEYYSGWDSESSDNQRYFPTNNAKIFHKFISDNKYQTVWENEIFRIMIPSDRIVNQ